MRGRLLLAFICCCAAGCTGQDAARADQWGAVYAPQPVYPDWARRVYLGGQGIFVLHVESDGSVSRVDVDRSTGVQALDKSAMAAYVQWLFKPGRAKLVRLPTNFEAGSPPAPVPR